MDPHNLHSSRGPSISVLSAGDEAGEPVQYMNQQIVPHQPSVIAVAVGKGDSSVQAVKWALETLMTSAYGPLHLLHVQDPLRLVQSPLGYLPIEQVNEECRKEARRQQFAATEKLLQKYKKLCEKKKVEVKVHCVESNSIQKAVVEQISKLGISKLVLGSSSKSKLKKFLKGPSTSAILAQYVPDFCVVLVVCKGRLSSVRDAKPSNLPSNSSPFLDTKRSFSVSDRRATYSEAGLCSPRTNDSLPYWTPSPRTDLSLPEWTPSPSTRCSSISDLGRREATVEDVRCFDTFSDQSRMNTSVRLRQSFSKNSSFSNTTSVSEERSAAQHRLKSVDLQDLRRTIVEEQSNPEVRDARFSIRGAKHEPLDSTSTFALMEPTGGIAQFSTGSCQTVDMASIEPARGIAQFSTGACQTVVDMASMEPTRGMAEFNTGACQPVMDLALAPLGKNSAQDSPAILKAKRFFKTASCVQDTQKSNGEGTAFGKLEAFKLQMSEEMRRRDDLCAFLQEALKVTEEKAQQALAKEVKRCEEVLNALSNAKVELGFFKQEADKARQQAAGDRVGYIGILANVEELKKELQKEIELRKSAEETAWNAKQDLARLLRKAHRDPMEYSYEELQIATNDFCEEGKLGEGGYGGVYKGALSGLTVAIKVLKQAGVDGQQQFQQEVQVLSNIRHQHIVMLLGACQERGCIVYEYMENGSLEDRLMCKDGTPPLPWYVRVRICFEVAVALIFLHNLSPNPIVHRDLKPGNILLDGNFLSKLSDAGLARWIPENETYNCTVYRETRPAGTFSYMDPEYLRTGSFGPHSDVFALGIIILQVLTGKHAVGVVELVEAAIDANRLHEVLDRSAGEWPRPAAEDLAKLGLHCAEPRRRDRPNLETGVFNILKRLREVAENAVLASSTPDKSCNGRCDQSCNRLHNGLIPSAFVCPLSQEIMKDPRIAADGFTYEFAAIKKWLDHHDNSPMTNLKLAHTQLCKNESLLTKLQSWNQECTIFGQPMQ